MRMGRDTKTAILDVAQNLIQTRGANAISYQHISERVQIRKASLHYHFPTKAHLLEAVLTRYCGTFLGLVDDILGSNEPATSKLRRYIGLFESALRAGAGAKICLCGMLGAELASLESPAVTQIRRFYRQNAERVGQILEAGRETGDLRFAGEAKTLGLLLFSLLEGAMLVARADGGGRKFRRVAEQFLMLVRP
jgi:TetR/AcrR family transcriptional regulator, transcriptional repressor for nem operon